MGVCSDNASCDDNLGRNDGRSFLPWRNRMWIWTWSTALSVILLPPSRSRFTNRIVPCGKCCCKCVWRDSGIWTQSYYIGNCTLEIIIHSRGCSDLLACDCGMVLFTGWSWTMSVFEQGGEESRGGKSTASTLRFRIPRSQRPSTFLRIQRLQKYPLPRTFL